MAGRNPCHFRSNRGRGAVPGGRDVGSGLKSMYFHRIADLATFAFPRTPRWLVGWVGILIVFTEFLIIRVALMRQITDDWGLLSSGGWAGRHGRGAEDAPLLPARTRPRKRRRRRARLARDSPIFPHYLYFAYPIVSSKSSIFAMFAQSLFSLFVYFVYFP